MDFAVLSGNLARVRDEIAQVQAREGLRTPVRIVAVTKGHGATAVEGAFRSGLKHIGENRVQEALRKQGEGVDLAVTWHLIGHLQTNKARQIPGRFGWVHSVDSERVAEALAQALAKASPPDRLRVLIQVNVAGEVQKNGCDPASVGALVERVRSLPHLDLVGLMTMAPFSSDERVQRPVFASLRTLRDALARDGVVLPELSMGMSGDFRAAVAEGATILRLGTVLFGERPHD